MYSVIERMSAPGAPAVEPRFGMMAATGMQLDALTGLPDRDHFVERTVAVLSAATGRTAVVLLDVDGLRRVNQGLGSRAGDEVLATLAQRLVAAGRPGDLVARTGGDEFAVLLGGLGDEDEARVMTRRLGWAVEQEYRVDTQRIHLRVAAGVALSGAGNDRDAAEKLLSDAETAMYAAKTSPDERLVVYTDELRQRSAHRFALESSLRRAVDRNAFQLHYQPQVTMPGRRLVGTEALLRWDDEQRGWMAPMDFIPIAEETGLIVPLGHWVLTNALTQLLAWQRAGHVVSMSVNVSARQFADPDFLFQVRELLDSTGVPAGSLTLEITESQVMRNLDIAQPAMLTLRGFGVRLSIDDFGTGYASLTQLKDIPADELKLDRSFIVGLEHDERDRGVIRGAVELAHALGMTVVAEGVETVAQLNFLNEVGCDALQGFLLGRPQTADELTMQLRIEAGAAAG